MAAVLVACSNAPTQPDVSQAEHNALNYAFNNTLGATEAYVTKADSVLSLERLAFNQAPLARLAVESYTDASKQAEYDELLKDYALTLDDAQRCMMYDGYSDSIVKLDKYENEWRKRFVVTVNCNDGTTKHTTVIIDNDGITPQGTEEDYNKKLRNYYRIFKKHLRNRY